MRDPLTTMIRERDKAEMYKIIGFIDDENVEELLIYRHFMDKQRIASSKDADKSADILLSKIKDKRLRAVLISQFLAADFTLFHEQWIDALDKRLKEMK